MTRTIFKPHHNCTLPECKRGKNKRSASKSQVVCVYRWMRAEDDSDDIVHVLSVEGDESDLIGGETDPDLSPLIDMSALLGEDHRKQVFIQGWFPRRHSRSENRTVFVSSGTISEEHLPE